MQHSVQHHRAILALAALLLATPAVRVIAQDVPARPDSKFMEAIRGATAVHHGSHANGGARHPRTIRARLRSSDGRVLISRSAEHHSFTWLAHDSAVTHDSAWFEVTLPATATEPVTVRDWKGRCLGHSQLHQKQPLDFGTCDRHQLFAYPAAAEDGFWLLSSLGYVGPTQVSSMLVPQSAANVWFRLEKGSARTAAPGR